MTDKTRVFNIDCMEYMSGLSDNAFDLAIVDPPYNLKPSSVRGAGKLRNRLLNMSDMEWDKMPPPDTSRNFSGCREIR